jgi:hypothetical protein
MPESDFASWVSLLPDHQGRVASRLRDLIFAAIPDATEAIKWSRPCYGTKAGGLICYLHASKSHVTLGFEKGTALHDPENLLEGTGKNMRHIKFHPDHDVDDSAVTALLQQALTIAG